MDLNEFVDGEFYLMFSNLTGISTMETDVNVDSTEDSGENQPISEKELRQIEAVTGIKAPQTIIDSLNIAITKLKNIIQSKKTTLQQMKDYKETKEEDIVKKEKAKLLAKRKVLEAQAIEPMVTKALEKLQDAELAHITFSDLVEKVNSHEIQDFKVLIGLEHKIKGEDRLAAKIYTVAINENKNLEIATQGIGDSLRYTLLIDDKNYVKIIDETLHSLEAEGYRVKGIKNSWDQAKYKGINTSIITPNGFIFELQFHTLASFYAKEDLTHDYYAIARNKDLKDKVGFSVCELANEIQILYQKLVQIPDGALDYKYNGGKNAN